MRVLITVHLIFVATAFAQERPPNIVLMIADDQGWADLSCAGLNEDAKTPALDALASTGVRFTQAYSTSPICNASRAGLITGCYQQRFGTFWYGGKGIHDARFKTLPELLSSRGYTRGYVGKFHYGSGRASQPDNRSFPLRHGFQSFFGFSGGRKHYMVHSAAAERSFQRVKRQNKRKGQSLRQGGMWRGDQKVDVEGFATHVFGEEARAFLGANKERPFYLHLGFNAVHNFTHQLPAEYLEEHELKGWRDWDPAKEDYYEWYRKGRKPNNPEGRAQYLGQLHYLDREVGRVVQCIEELGLRDDTIIIYIGDNGGSTPIYADNGPLRGSKYTLYEGGIRIPLIVSWPGKFKAGRVVDNVVSGMDMLPTLCMAAGVGYPKSVDGLDLGPLLRGERSDVGHDVLLWDTGHETAVRKGRYKLKTATSNRHAQYEMVEIELGTFLYDLEADPGETKDLKQTHPRVLAELKGIHQSWKRTLNN